MGKPVITPKNTNIGNGQQQTPEEGSQKEKIMKLKREIGLLEAVGIVIGSIIGSGKFF